MDRRTKCQDRQSAAVEGIDVIHVNDYGKIQALHAYWDPTPVMSVLQGAAGQHPNLCGGRPAASDGSMSSRILRRSPA